MDRISELEAPEYSEELWIIGEQRNNRLMDVSFELLGGGRELSKRLKSKLAVVVLGHKIKNFATELIAFGADKVYVIDAPQLRLYQSDLYANVLADLIRQQKPDIVLCGATTIGRDLAPRVAAKLKTGLTADCIDLSIDSESRLVQTVPGYGGNMLVNCLCPSYRPQMATVRPGVLEKHAKNENRQGEIVNVQIDIDESDFKARTLEIVEEESKGVQIEEADIVVAGGWGLRSPEDFKLLQELAHVLGGTVGGTRPLVDKGWISEEQMIGQSGKTVRPKLYVGVGISGAMHHMVGVKDAKIIVAINKDPRAPIFSFSDFGILGDLKEILPYLIKELQKKLHST